MRPATDEHDLQTKLRHIKRFLEEGDKVKVTLRFRGREMAHLELGMQRMERIIQEVAGIGEIEQAPKREGRMMNMIVVPVRKK